MSVTLKPYPEYKDSGVLWLGEIPRHWEVRRNGRLFAQRHQTGFANLPILEVSLRTGVRVRDFENSTRKQIMADRDKYKRAAKGDLAYNMMRMWQGAVGIAPVEGLISPAYVVARPFPEAEARYFNYLFHTNVYMDEVDKYSRGIVKDRNRLYWDEFKQIPSAFPPTDEQKTIADFLDAHTARTRQLVRAKRRLIELLNEQKQTIIHRAVTRGLDPNVRLKPSGIDWLGDVPEHWEVRRLKTIAQIIMGQSPASDECNTNGQGRPFLQGCAEFGDRHPLPVQFCPTASKVAPAESILLSVRAPVGALNIADQEYGVGRGLCAVLPFRSLLDLEFALHAISACKHQLLTIATGSTYDAVTVGEVGCVQLPLPPIAEQRQIVNRVGSESQSIDATIDRAHREIDLLREYRTRLIADVVMGKLDVRSVELPALDASEVLDDLDSDEEEALAEMELTEETADADTW